MNFSQNYISANRIKAIAAKDKIGTCPLFVIRAAAFGISHRYVRYGFSYLGSSALAN